MSDNATTSLLKLGMAQKMRRSGSTTPSWWASLAKYLNSSNGHLDPLRRLALQLYHELGSKDGRRSVMLASPTDSTYGSHASMSLAFCMAEGLRVRVLLIDVSRKRSEVTEILECGGSRGYSDLVADANLAFDELVLPTTHRNVCFLPVGALRDGRPPSVDAVRFFLQAAEERFDFLVLSGSPMSDFSVLEVAPHVGRLLLLAIENQTRLEDLAAAEQALTLCKAENFGLLLTKPIGGSFVRKTWITR